MDHVHSLAVAVTLFVTGCATRTLPPPPVPDRMVPLALPSDGPAAGHGRVLIDVVGEHATVERVNHRIEIQTFGGAQIVKNDSDVASTPLCTTPCLVELPYGSHEIKLGVKAPRRSDTDFVVAGPRPSVFRYAPGETRPHRAPQILGGTIAALGGIATFLGVVVIAGHKDTWTPEQQTGAVAFTAASAGVTGLGILLMALLPPAYRPATSRQWEVTR